MKHGSMARTESLEEAERRQLLVENDALQHELGVSRREASELREELAEARRSRFKQLSQSDAASLLCQLEKESEDLRKRLREAEVAAEKAVAGKAVAELRLQLGGADNAATQHPARQDGSRSDARTRITALEDRLDAQATSEARACEEEAAASRRLLLVQKAEQEVAAELERTTSKLSQVAQENVELNMYLQEAEQALQGERSEANRFRTEEIAAQRELKTQLRCIDKLATELDEAERLQSSSPFERDMEIQRIELDQVKAQLQVAETKILELENDASRRALEVESESGWVDADQAAGAPESISDDALIRNARAKASKRAAAVAAAEASPSRADYKTNANHQLGGLDPRIERAVASHSSSSPALGDTASVMRVLREGLHASEGEDLASNGSRAPRDMDEYTPVPGNNQHKVLATHQSRPHRELPGYSLAPHVPPAAQLGRRHLGSNPEPPGAIIRRPRGVIGVGTNFAQQGERRAAAKEALGLKTLRDIRDDDSRSAMVFQTDNASPIARRGNLAQNQLRGQRSRVASGVWRAGLF